MMKKGGLIVTGVIVFFVIGSIITAHDQFAAPAKPDVSKGKEIFAQFCAGCHGEKGDGKGQAAQFFTPKPRDFTDSKYMKARKDEDLARIIFQGKTGTNMPPFQNQLNEKERRDVLGYIRSLAK